jgi:hypothetical protein
MQGARDFGEMMSVKRNMRKLTLGKTTLRLLTPHQLKAVAGVEGVPDPEPQLGQDSYRGCGLQDTLLHP